MSDVSIKNIMFIVTKPSMNFLHFTYADEHLLLFGQQSNLDKRARVIIETDMERLDYLIKTCETSI